MKKILFLLLSFIVLAGSSCEKEEVLVNVDSISFGTAYGFCLGDCASFFKLTDQNIYPDVNTRYTGQGSITYSTSALPNDKYLLAKKLKESFPGYLLDHPDQTFGCPDCVDQGGIHIEATNNGQTFFWHIDANINKQPVEVKKFIERLKTIMTQL